ncbi:cupin domain-containing protein [Nocardia sp. CA-128927]|uniref:cupin domain-containing protein n=1 Tax=Nocardia sp. CA-128927 TaxID=3239975 RepID=UPI003D977D33
MERTPRAARRFTCRKRGIADRQLDVSGQLLEAGDVVVVPAGSPIAVGNPGDAPAEAFIAIAAGFEAVMPDGSRMSPPWAQ